MAEFSVPTAPDLDGLKRRLASRLRSYREWRGVPQLAAPEIREILPLWEIPRRTTISDDLRLESFGRWHVQVYEQDEPVHYARCKYREIEGTWRVDWIGESWLASHISDAIHRLEEIGARTDQEEVRLLSSRRYRFSAFWLHQTDEFLVASTTLSDLPLTELLPRERLRQRLVAAIGTPE